MRRILLTLIAAGALWAQKPEKPQPKSEEPPEEDTALKEKKEFSFNPVQAEAEIKIGNFYFKQGKLKAAILRFREATQWNPQSAEAFLRLGTALEKAKDKKAAREAFEKYLELAPDAKNVAEIKKKL